VVGWISVFYRGGRKVTRVEGTSAPHHRLRLLIFKQFDQLGAPALYFRLVSDPHLNVDLVHFHGVKELVDILNFLGGVLFHHLLLVEVLLCSETFLLVSLSIQLQTLERFDLGHRVRVVLIHVLARKTVGGADVHNEISILGLDDGGILGVQILDI
jgi:hypothetical protein